MLTLFSVAVFFVLEGAHFLAAVQVIVYAGAIVILFLFVIMLLGIDTDDVLDEPLRGQRPVAIAVGVALFAGLLLVAKILQPTGASAGRGSLTQGDVPNVERLARSLFTDFLLAVRDHLGAAGDRRRRRHRPRPAERPRPILDEDERGRRRQRRRP